jgi:membrane protease YdiL (CAAX protease family)
MTTPRVGPALGCYIVVIAIQLIIGVIIALIFFVQGIDILNPPFPIGLLLVPISAVSIGVVTYIFAKYQKMNIKDLGLKKITPTSFLIAIGLGVSLFILAIFIGIGQELLFGPDPQEEILLMQLLPQNPIQTVIMLTWFILLVGPMEEIFARGFIQKGLENSFGFFKGWLIASILFALLHAFNSLYSFLPVLTGGGLAIGYLWHKTGQNTTFAWIVHSTYDSVFLIWTLSFI